MTTKFNQGMYARMRAKKNEPLSNLGARAVCIVEKGVSIPLATLVTEAKRIASPATSVEEITPLRKKQRVVDKGKDKVNSRLSSVLDDTSISLVRAQETSTAEELRVFSGMSPNEVVDCHLHKLVQVVYLCKFISLFFFSFLFFFFFCIVLKFGSFFQVLREPSHHLGVPFLGGEGCVRDV